MAGGGKERSAILTRILIADDHEMVRSGLRIILDTQPGREVVAVAVDGKQAVAIAIEMAARGRCQIPRDLSLSRPNARSR